MCLAGGGGESEGGGSSSSGAVGVELLGVERERQGLEQPAFLVFWDDFLNSFSIEKGKDRENHFASFGLGFGAALFNGNYAHSLFLQVLCPLVIVNG